LPFTPSTAGFVPDVIAVIIGKDDAELESALSSAIAETLLNRSRHMAAFRVFKALLVECISKAEITERR